METPFFSMVDKSTTRHSEWQDSEELLFVSFCVFTYSMSSKHQGSHQNWHIAQSDILSDFLWGGGRTIPGQAEPYRKGILAPNRYLLREKLASKGGGGDKKVSTILTFLS